jgi:hypothetical protein
VKGLSRLLILILCVAALETIGAIALIVALGL